MHHAGSRLLHLITAQVQVIEPQGRERDGVARPCRRPYPWPTTDRYQLANLDRARSRRGVADCSLANLSLASQNWEFGSLADLAQ